MFHAYFYTICLVFCYTLWHFYAFSRTNLLTRCHSASSLFSAIFVFQKSYTANILRIGRNKSRTSYYLTKLPEDRRGDGEGPWSCEATLVHLWRYPFAYKDPHNGKNLKTRSIFKKHIAIHCCHRPKIGRVQKLFLAPCRRGESPPEVFFIAMLASGAMSE
jgi:hypothetical protein